MRPLDRLRAAACLVHAAPGVALLASTSAGERFVVARHRIDAAMDPSGFRSVVLAGGVMGEGHEHTLVTDARLIAGMTDLGGGLYEPAHPSHADERWFVTFLAAGDVARVAREVPEMDDSVEAVVLPDRALGVCAVRCVASRPGPAPLIDEIAFRLLSSCLAEELIVDAGSSVRP